MTPFPSFRGSAHTAVGIFSLHQPAQRRLPHQRARWFAMTPFPSFRGSAHTAVGIFSLHQPAQRRLPAAALLAPRAAFGGCALYTPAGVVVRNDEGVGTHWCAMTRTRAAFPFVHHNSQNRCIKNVKSSESKLFCQKQFTFFFSFSIMALSHWREAGTCPEPEIGERYSLPV